MTDEQINELADNLDSGLRCYVHRETKIIVTIPDSAFEIGNDSVEFWKDSIKEIKKDFKNYVEIEKMDSRESFRLMEDFIGTVENERLRDKLEQALSRPKPFWNFKFEVDNSGPYRQKWFDFKKQQLMEWVKGQLTMNHL